MERVYKIRKNEEFYFYTRISIPAPPLFIEEVSATLTEEFITTIFRNSLPASPYSLYKQRENWNTSLTTKYRE